MNNTLNNIPPLTDKEIEEIKKTLTELLIPPKQIAKGEIKHLKPKNKNNDLYSMHPYNDLDNRTYLVNFKKGHLRCDCDIGKETFCSHILAVAEFRAIAAEKKREEREKER